MTTAITDLDDFKALDPFFRITERGLEGIADGGHFFYLLAEDVIFDYIITTPGYPRRVEGRQAVAELYRSYGTVIVLDRCHDLAVHHDIRTGVVVLEYASEGGLRRARMAVTLIDGARRARPDRPTADAKSPAKGAFTF